MEIVVADSSAISISATSFASFLSECYRPLE
jgi:hypothetical protein